MILLVEAALFERWLLLIRIRLVIKIFNIRHPLHRCNIGTKRGLKNLQSQVDVGAVHLIIFSFIERILILIPTAQLFIVNFQVEVKLAEVVEVDIHQLLRRVFQKLDRRRRFFLQVRRFME